MRKRQRSASVAIRDSSVLDRIEARKADHPAWGYRRIWSYLRYRDGLCIGKNRVYRLLREHRLLATHTKALRARRGPLHHKPRTTIPNRIWGIDMTKIHVYSWGWLYLHLVLDWGTKKVAGWHLSTTSKTKDWLTPLSAAINAQFPNGRDGQPAAPARQ
jgi:putative transposase